MPPLMMFGTTRVSVTCQVLTEGSSLILLSERANDPSTRKLELRMPSYLTVC